MVYLFFLPQIDFDISLRLTNLMLETFIGSTSTKIMWTKLLAPRNSSMPNLKKVLVSEFAFLKTAYILWIIPKAHFCSLTWQNGKYLRSELLSVWSQAEYVTFHTIITGFIIHTFIQDDILLHDLIFFCMIQLICVVLCLLF